MRKTFSSVAIALLLGLAVVAAVAVGSRPAAARPAAVSATPVTLFHGSVTNTNRHGRWFDVRVTTTSRIVRFHTVATTRWESCDWSDLDRGHLVAVGARKAHGLWLAATIRALHHPEAEH